MTAVISGWRRQASFSFNHVGGGDENCITLNKFLAIIEDEGRYPHQWIVLSKRFRFSEDRRCVGLKWNA